MRVRLFSCLCSVESLRLPYNANTAQIERRNVTGKNLHYVKLESFFLLCIGQTKCITFIAGAARFMTSVHCDREQRVSDGIALYLISNVALADARKGVSMFQSDKVNVPILGIVENMSWFTPASHPDERYYIFGKDGGKNLAEKLNVTLLGQIPLVASICKGGDDGVPVTLQNSISGAAFIELARKVAAATELRNNSLPPTHKVEFK